ncbi:MAG: undecaprenyldiphospho-muramoylpentapeptide beta-N-acetylglucosaminyltransferase [Ruminococcaceae bacterium]|nr:undecaprenyldiphospho-muramoylpentapeptide beta-N-acetylglucosaminyltransferase [Oscillospiraceae bacterium]
MKVMIAAGGTGGHVNPALAVAGEIKKQYPDAEICFVGTADRIEADIVPAAGFPLKTIEISGFKRGFSPADIKANVKTVTRLLKSSGAVKKIINEFNPDVAVGFGGYVSGPVIRMAAKMGIPTAIHEQNAYPGVTNKALSEKVDAVMLTVEAAKKHLKCKNDPIITGLPVRGELLEADGAVSRKELGFNDNPIILCMGGSLGARAINEAIVEVVASHKNDTKYNYLISTGKYGTWVPERLQEKGVDLENSSNIQVRTYINDMDRCLSAADLVICRAGASSLSEFEALGKASILIPSPNVTENHQFHNAMALVDNNAAVIIEEKDLNGEILAAEIDKLLSDKAKLKEIGDNARKMAVVDAASRICGIVTGLIKN